MPTTVTSLVIVVLFVLPCFIYDWTFERLVRLRAKTDLERILTAIAFSAVIWLIPGVPLYHYWLHTRNLTGIAWYSSIFIVAVPIALAAAVKFVGPFVRKLLRLVELPVQNPEPTSWDSVWRRSDHQGGTVVIVQTTNGQTYGGLYGANSQAGSFAVSPDLYLEQAWKIDGETKGFTKKGENSGGLYFPASSIQLVEFRGALPEGVSAQTPANGVTDSVVVVEPA